MKTESSSASRFPRGGFSGAHDFKSLAAVIAAAHRSSDGTGTVITLPNQNTITLAGLTEKEIKADAKQIGHFLLG